VRWVGREGPDGAPSGVIPADLTLLSANETTPFGDDPYLNGAMVSPICEVTRSAEFTTLTLCQTVDPSRS
jgi:hypothetical protein